MNMKKKNIAKTNQNVMELLVKEEIERQVNRYPVNLKKYINKLEVATYALNRLPALYASSHKGKNQQKIIGKKKFKHQITMAVRQGLAAVQRDPLRVSTPLISEADIEYQTARTALQDIHNLLEERNLLDYQELSWDNLVNVIQRALNKTAWVGIGEQPKPNDKFTTQANDWADFRYHL